MNWGVYRGIPTSPFAPHRQFVDLVDRLRSSFKTDHFKMRCATEARDNLRENEKVRYITLDNEDME